MKQIKQIVMAAVFAMVSLSTQALTVTNLIGLETASDEVYSGFFATSDSVFTVDFSSLAGDTIGFGLANLSVVDSDAVGTVTVSGSDGVIASYGLMGGFNTNTGYFLLDLPVSDLMLDFSITGASFTTTVLTAGQVAEVPVPAAAFLFGSAVIALAGVGRSRKVFA